MCTCTYSIHYVWDNKLLYIIININPYAIIYKDISKVHSILLSSSLGLHKVWLILISSFSSTSSCLQDHPQLMAALPGLLVTPVFDQLLHTLQGSPIDLHAFASYDLSLPLLLLSVLLGTDSSLLLYLHHYSHHR